MATIGQPLKIEHNDSQITLSGLRQLLERLPPEKVGQLQNDLQAVLNSYAEGYGSILPSPTLFSK
jgi:hypothetical protein